MKESLFNNGWLYCEQPAGTPAEAYRSCGGWQEIDIPHDMLIHDAHHFYKSCVGLYKKEFTLPVLPEGKLLLHFDGVYPECRVLLNDTEIRSHKYGYSAFYADMTPALKTGVNILCVWVNHLAPNSRWYSGAGIFRDVSLCALPPEHFLPEGIYIHTDAADDGFSVTVSAETAGAEPETPTLRYTLTAPGGETVLTRETTDPETRFFVEAPALWDLDSPQLYTLRAELFLRGELRDSTEERFGFRSFRFDPDQGFFLNGKHVKLNGVCLHHDLGSLGAAFYPDALRRQLVRMKEMGANAVRTSHNMPARQMMELADELGMLIDSEAFDMWGKPKTEFDNARFFHETCEEDVESWVRRDRNHPSLILWSIGNEIYDTHDGEYGREEMRRLIRAVKRRDPLKNAWITFGSNYIPWENTQKCAEELDAVGANYAEAIYGELHEKHPSWCLYGSETAARGQSRGIYHFPLSHTARTYEDMQMSSLENSRSGVGDRTPQDSILWDRDCPFSAGQFIWTGFDYLGEPTPYSTKNSYYGQCDTAGIRKDSYFLYQAAWTDKTVLHLMPYWDFNEGQMIDVCAYTNAPEAELFLNGRSLGRQARGERYWCKWRLPYEKGELRAFAYDSSGSVIAEDAQRSFGDGVTIKISAEQTEIPANGRSLIFAEISTEDENGVFVANARSRMRVEVSGAGRLVGLDNGDSTDYESFQGTSKKLFSGRLAAIIAAKQKPGEILLRVSSEGFPEATARFFAVPCKKAEGVSCLRENSEALNAPVESGIPIRKIALSCSGSQKLNEENPEAEIRAEVFPENASGEILFSAVTDSGIVTNLAEVTADGHTAKVRALGDGEFRLRCAARNGKDCTDVISDLEFSVSGMGSAVLNPYSFVSATFYSRTNAGALDEVLNGGVRCVKNGETQICFDNVDFGRDFSEEITVPILRWFRDSEMPVEIWENMPGEAGARQLWSGVYQRPFIWQTYQPLVCRLSERLTGLKSICVVCRCGDDDVNVQGFSFRRLPRAYETLTGAETERVYGDSFRRDGAMICGIGNNVTLDFGRLCFSDGFSAVRICGRTENESDSVHLILGNEREEKRQMAQFVKREGLSEQIFPLSCEPGEYDVRLMFLPGCRFDFSSITFLREVKNDFET